MKQRLEDRMALKDLVDRYATESDKNNHEYYREIFCSNVKVKVYFGDKLGMEIDNVEDMIVRYKAFGAAKASFHQNGQQVVDFIDDTRNRYLLCHRHSRYGRRRKEQVILACRPLLRQV